MGDDEKVHEEDIELAESIKESVSEPEASGEAPAKEIFDSSAKSAGLDDSKIPIEEIPPEGKKPKKASIISSYSFSSEGIPVEVKILKVGDFVPKYEISKLGIDKWTELILQTKLRGELVSEVKLEISEILDPRKFEEVKAKFLEAATKIIEREFQQQTLSEEKKRVLAVYLLQNTLGLGELENLLYDDQLEEVVINNSNEPVWVYHKKYGWCKTNLRVKNEELIYDYAAMIARKIGRQINVLNPMLDAHLSNGDRVNATMFPISNYGNTITIRKFSKNPWTITNFIKSKTVSPEVAGLIWLCIQNELSLIVSGGTGSGKTSFLNAMAGLIPANQRIISIEDTRELTLPSFLHWVPMITREPNPEGKGEVTMLDLMVNALRQRPDRIIVGEIRRQREAEVLFEAMHTGHSVYATLHADDSEQTLSRLTNPPINVPKEMFDALAGVVVQFRHRRFNIRRTLEFSEVGKKGGVNTLYRWDMKNDKVKSVGKMSRLSDLLSLYAGMDEKEISQDVDEKVDVLNWMVKMGYESVDQVGTIVSEYYIDPDAVLSAVKKGAKWEF